VSDARTGQQYRLEPSLSGTGGSTRKETIPGQQYPVRAVKTFPYRIDLFQDMIQRRLGRRESLTQPKEMDANDPRQTSRNISAVPPPSTRELVALKQSRFES
jgi:hypothetical protein